MRPRRFQAKPRARLYMTSGLLQRPSPYLGSPHGRGGDPAPNVAGVGAIATSRPRCRRGPPDQSRRAARRRHERRRPCAGSSHHIGGRLGQRQPGPGLLEESQQNLLPLPGVTLVRARTCPPALRPFPGGSHVARDSVRGRSRTMSTRTSAGWPPSEWGLLCMDLGSARGNRGGSQHSKGAACDCSDAKPPASTRANAVRAAASPSPTDRTSA
jgi:hypothetical protein